MSLLSVLVWSPLATQIMFLLKKEITWSQKKCKSFIEQKLTKTRVIKNLLGQYVCSSFFPTTPTFTTRC